MTSNPTNPAELFSLQIQKVQSLLSPLLKQPLDEIQHEMTPLEKAKLNACLAYAANTLFYMYLKAKGVSSQEHPVQLEMKRIQQYIMKIREVQNETEGTKPASAPVPASTSTATPSVPHSTTTTTSDSNKITPGKRKRSDSSNKGQRKSKKPKKKGKR